MIIKLTSDFITNSLQCLDGKRRIEYVDESRSGFYVEVRATQPGKGTYYLRYKDANNKTCHQKIARTTDIPLAEARERAIKLKAEITLGKDPRAEEKARKSVLTLAEFMEGHYFPYARQRKRTAGKDEELFRLRLRKAFGNVPINQISRRQIQLFHTSVREEGLAPASCDHYLKLLRHALNLAVDWEMLEKNPAARVPLFNVDNKIEHYMEEKQLEQLMRVLITDSNRPVCSIVLFLLSTGARLNEALQAEWKYIDQENKVWRIPSEISKSKKVRSIPLNDTALAILDELNTQDEYDHLFVNTKTGNPYTTIHKVWDRLRKEAELPHLRLHDMRHAYASYLVSSGHTLYEVQQILGHSDPSVTMRYAHLSTAALQRAANSASDIITGAMPKP